MKRIGRENCQLYGFTLVLQIAFIKSSWAKFTFSLLLGIQVPMVPDGDLMGVQSFLEPILSLCVFFSPMDVG